MYQVLKTINGKKATGYDNIPPHFIKAAAREIAHPRMSAINRSIRSNHFSNVKKYAEMSPLYKVKIT